MVERESSKKLAKAANAATPTTGAAVEDVATRIHALDLLGRGRGQGTGDNRYKLVLFSYINYFLIMCSLV